ncbi:hypothetical protein SAMN05444392_11658 [Seinonella peptonophila]|uniref:TrbL/VirB6 plasmid conjugal transfer protein n=1 Tax=Seinonella peptonophila TaxID=112248 RepID=A0A1M5AXD4_9BACL|nr:hypothetical protein [Seinonella peptonophila]SHF34908.1 hypothetical protein SAMN05444392_11658 [Seinonella peptonophila]
MIKMWIRVLLGGLLFFIVIPQIVYGAPEQKVPDWNWISKTGQWIGNLFKEGGKRLDHWVSPNQYSKKKEKSSDSVGINLIDNLLPHSKGNMRVGRVEVLYNQYPLSHYQIDLSLENPYFWEFNDKANNVGNYFFNEINNAIWKVNVFGSRVTVWVLENAINLNLVEDIGQSISEALKRLAGISQGEISQKGIYGLLFPLMVIIMGFWVGWQSIALENEEGAIKGIIHACVVIFFALSFFYYSHSIIQSMNQASSGMTKEFLGISTNLISMDSIDYTSDEAEVRAGNNLWNVMVFKPYLLLQYGTTSVEEKRRNDLLKQDPQSKKRADLVKKEISVKSDEGYENKNMTSSNNSTRLGFIVMVLCFNVVLGLMVILLSAGIPFFQLYFMFLILLSPIALAWAIVPFWKESLYRWSSEVLGALLMKLSLGVVLAIFFAFSSALYDFSEEKGYVFMMFMQLCLLALLFWKSKEIFQLVTAPAVWLGKSGTGVDQTMEILLRKLSSQLMTKENILGKIIPNSDGNSSMKVNILDSNQPKSNPLYQKSTEIDQHLSVKKENQVTKPTMNQNIIRKNNETAFPMVEGSLSPKDKIRKDETNET